MSGANPNANAENNLSEGSKATHIGPETGDTARATAREDSSAGTHGSQQSPPEGAGLGKANRPVRKLDDEGRSFSGEDANAGDESFGGAAEQARDVADGRKLDQ
jgi:hypothetical protein